MNTNSPLGHAPLFRMGRRAAALLVFAFIVHTLVIPQIGGARKALTVVSSVSPWLIGLAVILEALALASYAELTRRLARPVADIGFGRAMTAVLSSVAVSHVVPGGAATTAAANYRVLGKTDISAADLGFVVGVQAIGSAIVLNVLLWIALLWSIPATGFHPIYATAAALGMVLMAAVAAAVATILRGRDRFATRLAMVIGRLPRVDGNRVEGSLRMIADSVHALAGDRRRLLDVTALAAANWLFDAAALWVMITAFGHRPGVVGVIVAYGLANVVAVIPVSPGGLGVIEAVLIPSLVGFGTPRAEASIAVVAYRLVSFWLPIPAGAVAFAVDEQRRPEAPEPEIL